MKTQKEIDELAKQFAGIALHVDIDEEERYYNGHACKVYDAFIAGYNEANNKNQEEYLAKLAELLTKHNVRKHTCINGWGYSKVERDIVDLFLNP